MLFSSLILLIQLSVTICQGDHDDRQQIQFKVERINLSDFGFQKKNTRTINDRIDDHGQNKYNRPFIPTNTRLNISGNRDTVSTRFTNYRRRQPENTGRRDIRNEFHTINDDKSLPLQWTATIFPTNQSLTSKQPFDLISSDRGSDITREQSPNRTNRQNQQCLQKCVAQKYLQHYYAKGCSPIIDFECDCPLAFNCPPDNLDNNSTICKYEGRVYPISSRIPVHNPCRICECRPFTQRSGEISARIDCGIGIECPESAFGINPEPNCYFGYERNKCCGQQICNQNPLNRQKVCNFNGKQYKKGQKIYPEQDKCKICLCNDDWNDTNPLNSSACYTYKCEFELNVEFQKGCLPIYHEGSCCPIEYKCGNKLLQPLSTRLDINSCVFGGKKYPIGSKLDTDNVCTECLCKTPPDFTCVQKSCPSPPRNCYIKKWNRDICCQEFICSQNDPTRDESQFRANFYSDQNN